jgi:hypothetical protein
MLTRFVKGVTVAGHTVLLGSKGGVQNFDRTLLYCSKRNVKILTGPSLIFFVVLPIQFIK